MSRRNLTAILCLLTAAENAKAYGEIAAGAWDRLFKGSE